MVKVLRIYISSAIVLTMVMIASSPSFSQVNGDEVRVWTAKIEGNITYSEIVLKNVIAIEGRSIIDRLTTLEASRNRYDEDEAKRDVIRLTRFYKRRGFPNINVEYEIRDTRQEDKKEVAFIIEEGDPVIIRKIEYLIKAEGADSLRIVSDRRFQRALNRRPFRINRRFESIKVSESEGAVVEALNNLGYYRAQANIDFEIDTLNMDASVYFDVNPGTKTYVNAVRIDGNDLVPEYYISRETGIEPGDLFSERDIRSAQRELFNHHIVRFVTTDVEELEADSLVDLVFRVSERDLRAFRFRAGIGVDRDLNNEIINLARQLRGEVSWTYRNVRNRGERFRTIVRASGFNQSIIFDYYFPYVFNTNSSGIITPSFEHRIEPSFEIIEAGIQNNLIYEYTRELTGTISYDFSFNQELTSQSSEELPDSVLNYNVSSILLSGIYQDGIVNNQSGWSIRPFLELSGLFGEADFSFQKLSVDIRRFQRTNSDFSFAARMRWGLISYAGNDSLPQNIRFFNGGTSRVRGYSRDLLGPKRPVFLEDGSFDRYLPTGGRARYNFTVEARKRIDRIIKGFEVTAFLDGGQVWTALGGIDLGDTQFGAGGGLRYRSPIGPIRLEFARKLNPTDADLNIFNGQDFGDFFDRQRIHFSVGASF